MKKITAFLMILCLFCGAALPALAGGQVTYSGDSGQFIFAPGSQYSPTDLFADFKDVMPGDTLTQQITVKNEASDQVKVKIYLRALGAHADSAEFLSQLGLKVQKSTENEMGYMFDGAADETARLTDWVELGTLYSGGRVNLDVLLEVPVELDNKFSDMIGYLDWEFMVEEFPAEKDDPKPPDTGDGSKMGLWIGLAVVSALLLLILVFWRRKKDDE